MMLLRAFEILLKLTLCLDFKRFKLVRTLLFPLHLVCVPYLLFQKKHKRIRLCLQSLGVVFIKLGQSLSLKSFLFSKETLQAFSYLQDSVPAMKRTLTEILQMQSPELLNRKNLQIEQKAIASASVAQVHVGCYNGKRVAVKILKIGVEKKIENDFKIIFFLVKIINKFISPAFQIVEVTQDIYENLIKEVDLTNEMGNLKTIHRNLVLDAKIAVPNCYEEVSNNKVLVMDFAEGEPLRKVIYGSSKGMNRKTVAVNVVQAYLVQVYRDGVFHADMHAGNIFVKKNGDISLIDFGLISVISIEDRRAVATMIYGFLKQNYELVLRAQLNAGYITDEVFYNNAYRQAMKNLAKSFLGGFEMSVFTQELFTIMNDFNVFVPKHLLMLNKTILYVEDISKQLDAEFNPLMVISPWIGRWYKKQRILMFFEGIVHKMKA